MAALIIILMTGLFGVFVESAIVSNDSKLYSVLPLDRGYVGTPPVSGTLDLSNQEMASLTDELVEQVHCSFVFSQLAHMYLTKMYIKDTTNLSNITDWTRLTFTDEAKYILNVLYNDQVDSSIKAVAWTFAVYADRAAVFFESYWNGAGGLSNRLVLSAHNAVVTVLEEYVDTKKCMVYDRETGELENTKYKDKIQQYVDGKAENGLKLTNSVLKQRFAEQRKENAKHGFPEMGVERFEMDVLRLDNFMTNQRITYELDMAFGVQLDWDSIWNALETANRLSYSSDITLYRQISSLVQFQSNVMFVLEAIAMRIVIGYLMTIKQILSSSGVLSPKRYYLPKCNYTMAEHFADFAVHVGNHRDMENITNSLRNCKNVQHIDDCINNIFELLKEKSRLNDNFSSFGTPIKENEEYSQRSMIQVDKVAKKYNLNQSINVHGYHVIGINRSVRKNLVCMQVFAGYVKTITKPVDFEVINSFISMDWYPFYNRLKQIEEMREIEKDEETVPETEPAIVVPATKPDFATRLLKSLKKSVVW